MDLQICNGSNDGYDLYDQEQEKSGSGITSTNNEWLGSYKAFGKAECCSSKAGEIRYQAEVVETYSSLE